MSNAIFIPSHELFAAVVSVVVLVAVFCGALLHDVLLLRRLGLLGGKVRPTVANGAKVETTKHSKAA
jgi:hypothetical protein